MNNLSPCLLSFILLKNVIGAFRRARPWACNGHGGQVDANILNKFVVVKIMGIWYQRCPQCYRGACFRYCFRRFRQGFGNSGDQDASVVQVSFRQALPLLLHAVIVVVKVPLLLPHHAFLTFLLIATNAELRTIHEENQLGGICCFATLSMPCPDYFLTSCYPCRIETNMPSVHVGGCCLFRYFPCSYLHNHM